MSDEFLRGVLEASMAKAELAIYTLEAIVPAGPPTTPFGTILHCKMDRYFLAMACELKGVSVADVLNDLSWNDVQITNPKDYSVYSNVATRPALFGGNLNGLYNLDTYMLFEPAGLIGFQITNNATQGTALTVGSTVTLTLYGVEYAPKG